MQDLINQLNPTIAVILIVVGILVLVIVVILSRRLRRRQTSLDDALGPSPGLSGSVDYTSLPIDEPNGWRERFANLSLAGKILIILGPILALLVILVLVLTLMPKPEPPVPVAPLPTPLPPASITIAKAVVVSANPVKISIIADVVSIPDGTAVVIEMLADGEPISYLHPDYRQAEVQGGRVEIKPLKADDGPALDEDVAYSIRVRTDDGATSADLPLEIPDVIKADLFAAAVMPTAESNPTLAGTEVAADVTPGTATTAQATSTTAQATSTTAQATSTTAQATSTTAQATATPTPTSVPLAGMEVKVSNGGNVRSLPFYMPTNRIGGVNAGDVVELLERTPNAEWYRISFVNTDDGQRKEGWISASLLSIPAEIKAKVTIANIVSVFVEGPVYAKPNTTSTRVDQVNVNEVVKLTHKTAAGDWYEVETVRGNVGWVAARLLGIPADVAAKVAVSSGE